MRQRHPLTFVERCLLQVDQALRTCVPGASLAHRDSPAEPLLEADMNTTERRRVAGLMRVNHTGEVCAQALYAGQAATARLGETRQAMEQAAQEEVDHLAWCEQRLQDLDSRPSALNPLWYGLSFGMGAAAGLAGDKWSLGFVAETERQVCMHLEQHLDQLPPEDHRSRAVLEQMISDERRHGESAEQAGGAPLPTPVRGAMAGLSQVMKKTTYHV